MAKKIDETPTNIISGEPVVLPASEPAKSEAPSAPVVNIDMKPFADAMTSGFNSIADKLTAAFKPETQTAPKIETPAVIPPVIETQTPPKKSSVRIFDELDPSALFEFGK